MVACLGHRAPFSGTVSELVGELVWGGTLGNPMGTGQTWGRENDYSPLAGESGVFQGGEEPLISIVRPYSKILRAKDWVRVGMRSLYFLLPGTTGPYRGGGLFAELRTLALMAQMVPAQVVTYRQREPDTLFLPDLLRLPRGENPLAAGMAIVSWGFDVPRLLRQLQPYPCVYHAHSTGYGFRVAPEVPIVAVSRNTLGYWGQRSPQSPLFYLPNHIGDEFGDRGVPFGQRDIDVLVQGRKSSQYLRQRLIPALEQRCRVQVIEGYVADLGDLFNRAKVYLYDSADHWAIAGLTEGFGLPPLEALACGCQVFSSVNHALADYLDPGFVGEQVGVFSLAYDVERILAAIVQPAPPMSPGFFTPYRTATLLPRCHYILAQLNHFFDHRATHPRDIPTLTPTRITHLRWQRLWQKVQDRLQRKPRLGNF